MMVATSPGARRGLPWSGACGGNEVVPEGAAGRGVRGGAVGKGDVGKVAEDVFGEGERVFKRADERGNGLAVAEEGGEGHVAGGGEEGHADVAGHPDGEVGHDPPGAVLGDDDDVGAGGPALGFDPRGHAAGFLHGAGPGPFEELAVDGLREERLQGSIVFARVDSLQR